MKQTIRWILAAIAFAMLALAFETAAAEKGKTLEPRIMVPAEEMPRKRSGEGIEGVTQNGSTCAPYTYTVNDGSDAGNVMRYRYLICILDDIRPGQYSADTLYKSNLTESSQFAYTFYQTGAYVLFAYRYSDEEGKNPVYYNGAYPYLWAYIYITQDSANNPLTAAVNAAANECASNDEFATAVAINDYLAEINRYDYSYTYYSPEAALLGSDYGYDHTSVCNGYSRAYQMIATACGLECRRVTGNAGGGGHAWDVVKINGNWYQVDPTWNDGKVTNNGVEVDNSSIRHVYMGLSDEVLGIDHSDFDYPQGRVSCSTLEDNYFIHTGKWTDLAESAAYGETSVMQNVQAALDGMDGNTAAVTADFGLKAWKEGGSAASNTNYSTKLSTLRINGNVVAYALNHTQLYRNDGSEMIPVKSSFSYVYDSTGSPKSALTGEVTAGETDAARVLLIVPCSENEPLTACTMLPITIQAPGAARVSFFDGECWSDPVPGQDSFSVDMPVRVAGTMTLQARAYFEDPGEWVFSNAETRTFAPAQVLDMPVIEIASRYLNGGVARGTVLPMTIRKVNGAERYTICVMDKKGNEIYRNLRLNTEDMTELPGGGYGKQIELPTDGMAKGDYSILVTASVEGYIDSTAEAFISVTDGNPAGTYISVDKESVLIGENVVIRAHLPEAAHIGAESYNGTSMDGHFCDAQDGDTGIWTRSFDSPGTYQLYAIGWSEERWNNEAAREFPDFRNTAVYATVTVQTPETETEPDVEVTVPSPLTGESMITIQMGEVPGAVRCSVSCTQEGSGITVFSRESREPFSAAIPAAWLKTSETYILSVRIDRIGYYGYESRHQLIRSDFAGNSFTISLDGKTADAEDGTYHVLLGSQYKLICEDLPEGIEAIEVLAYGDGWYEYEYVPQGTEIEFGTQGEDYPLIARYRDEGGGLHYSNMLQLTGVRMEDLTKLVLPGELKKIETNAFEGINAQAVFIPDGCESVKSGAFRNCPNLIYVQYYEGTEVEAGAFAECNSPEIRVVPVN